MTSNASNAIVVTGSSGLIGSNLVSNLACEYQVFCLDSQEPKEELPLAAEFVQVDLASEASVERAFTRIRANHADIVSVVHLAAYYDFSGEPSAMYDKVTVQGTRRILRQSREVQAEQFIFSSTMLAHQPTTPGVPINEDWPLESKWDYPRSKAQAERLVEDEHGTMPCVLQRIAGVYTDVCDSIPLAHQIQRIYEKRLTAHVYPGDTSRGQSFVHLDDVIEAIRLTIEKRDQLSGVIPILIGESETYSYDQLQREIALLIHGESEWRTEQIPKIVARTGAWIQGTIPGIEEPFIKPWMIDLADDHYELDISRARQLLGWEPRHRLIDTLPRMIGELKADPEYWYERHGLPVTSSVGK
jgi:nucleoside-diphosphate-sugar epimerase